MSTSQSDNASLVFLLHVGTDPTAFCSRTHYPIFKITFVAAYFDLVNAWLAPF